MAVDDENEEIVQEFLVESGEHLDRLDRDLVTLEEDPTNREVLASIFRAIHTIKGTCGFLAYAKLESVSHVAESLLVRLRDGSLTVTPEIASALLATTDAIRDILASIASTREEGAGDYSALVAKLTALQASGEASASAPAPESASQATAIAKPADAVAPDPAAKSAEAGETKGYAPGATIRVDVGLLDKLLNLAGELVLASNQILAFAACQSDVSFFATTQSLNLITTELQEGVMKTRMQPVRNLWDKLPRVVRDLAVVCGKKVRLDMDGGDTELDKLILEAIKDPLTHLLRNCVDHGLEAPEVRVAAGKPAEGRVALRAYHAAGCVNIEISDDGGGIDPTRVRDKAIERGLVTAEQAARMSEGQVVSLIFLPGFSTAEKVTNVSGRGVGMDVVKTNIEKIGGSIDIKSTVGVGTTQRIRIPLTLAVIPALIATSGSERFAIPHVNLVELVRHEGAAPLAIETIHGAPHHRLRGHLLPLVYLDRELGVVKDESVAAAQSIIVLEADDRRFGLVVDGIHGTEEIVGKPLGPEMKRVPVFAGTTNMSDGIAAMILDVVALAELAVVAPVERDRAVAQAD